MTDREQAAVDALRAAGRDMMADLVEAQISPEFDAGQGWRVVDADGNVVQSGGISIAQADGKLAQLLEQFSTEGEQE